MTVVFVETEQQVRLLNAIAERADFFTKELQAVKQFADNAQRNADTGDTAEHNLQAMQGHAVEAHHNHGWMVSLTRSAHEINISQDLIEQARSNSLQTPVTFALLTQTSR